MKSIHGAINEVNIVYTTIGLDSGNVIFQKMVFLLAPSSMADSSIALGIVSVAFAFVYRYGPSRHQADIPIFSGAVFAAVLWALFSALFRFYVVHLSNFTWAYGTIGTFIMLLLWLDLSSLAMLLGAQLNVTVGKAMKQSRKW